MRLLVTDTPPTPKYNQRQQAGDSLRSFVAAWHRWYGRPVEPCEVGRRVSCTQHSILTHLDECPAMFLLAELTCEYENPTAGFL